MSGWLFERVAAGRRSGSEPRRGGQPPRLVLHTTESVSPTPARMRRAFEGHSWPPHIWCSFAEVNGWSYKKGFGGSRVRSERIREGYDLICQRVPLDRTAYALLAPTVKGKKWETNHMGRFCVQVEIEGWAADTENWPDSVLEKLGRRIVAPITGWIRANGFPLWAPEPYRDVGLTSGSYGSSGAARMSENEWETCRRSSDGQMWGVATHQDVPANKHWDCGGIKLAKICAWAEAELAGAGEMNRLLDDCERRLGEAQKLVGKMRALAGGSAG